MLKVINWKHQIYRNKSQCCVWYFFKIQIKKHFFLQWRCSMVCVCVDRWMCVLFNQWRLNGWLVMWQIGYLIPPRYFTQYLHELAAVYRDRESSWQDGCVREKKNKNRQTNSEPVQRLLFLSVGVLLGFCSNWRDKASVCVWDGSFSDAAKFVNNYVRLSLFIFWAWGQGIRAEVLSVASNKYPTTWRGKPGKNGWKNKVQSISELGGS